MSVMEFVRARQVGIFPKQKCKPTANQWYRGSSNRRTPIKENRTAYSICENFKIVGDHINVNVLQCKEITQCKRITVSRQLSQEQKDRNPHRYVTCNKLGFRVENSKRIDIYKGLITPEDNSVHKKLQQQRQNKIRKTHRLTQQFPQHRERALDLMTKRESVTTK